MSPQKGFITDRNILQFHQLPDWLVSDVSAGEEAGKWKSWAGIVTHGLWM
jgi:hypothetical protein